MRGWGNNSVMLVRLLSGLDGESMLEISRWIAPPCPPRLLIVPRRHSPSHSDRITIVPQILNIEANIPYTFKSASKSLAR